MATVPIDLLRGEHMPGYEAPRLFSAQSKIPAASKSQKSDRIHRPALDSIRGIAAGIVVLHHITLMLNLGQDPSRLIRDGYSAPGAWLYLTPLRLLVAGPSMVLLFFVLSGLVLTLSVQNGSKAKYTSYAVRRFCRIWLPFAVVIVASWATALKIYAGDLRGGSGWFNFTWSGSLSISTLGQHLLMTGKAVSLDSSMWSLIHEMRISLVFPLLLLAIRVKPRIALALLFVAALTAPVLSENLPTNSIVFSALQSATFLITFGIGIIIALNLRILESRLAKLKLPIRGLLWLVSAALISIGPLNASEVVGLRNAVQAMLAAAGCGIAIILVTSSSSITMLLMRSLPSYLGRISYSLYLVHLVVIVCVGRLLAPYIALEITVLVSLPVTILVADLCQRFVEIPTMRFGRKLARIIDANPPRSSSGLDFATQH